MSSLTEKERDDSGPVRSGLSQLVDDSTQEHCFTLSWVSFDPEQLIVLLIAPLFEIIMVEDPAICTSEQSTLVLLDTIFVMARIGRL